MTARRVFRILLVLIALALGAYKAGLFGPAAPSPPAAARREPVVVQVPPSAIGRESPPAHVLPSSSTPPGHASDWGDSPLGVVGSIPDGPDGRHTFKPQDLSVDEARGGHTIARHVGKSKADLRERLARERQISVASTYTDLGTAQWVVALALRHGAARVTQWAARQGPRPNLALDFAGESRAVIGRSLARGDETALPCYDAVVVLRWEASANDWYVLTSYPEVRRGTR